MKNLVSRHMDYETYWRDNFSWRQQGGFCAFPAKAGNGPFVFLEAGRGLNGFLNDFLGSFAGICVGFWGGFQGPPNDFLEGMDPPLEMG